MNSTDGEKSFMSSIQSDDLSTDWCIEIDSQYHTIHSSMPAFSLPFLCLNCETDDYWLCACQCQEEWFKIYFTRSNSLTR